MVGWNKINPPNVIYSYKKVLYLPKQTKKIDMNYRQIVDQMLTEYKELRDDDQKLYAYVLHKLGFHVKNKSAYELIKGVRSKSLPSLDTITRLRRMSQMENHTLRGSEWDIRHGKKVEKALSELGYASASN
jgi:hypothetical protein